MQALGDHDYIVMRRLTERVRNDLLSSSLPIQVSPTLFETFNGMFAPESASAALEKFTGLIEIDNTIASLFAKTVAGLPPLSTRKKVIASMTFGIKEPSLLTPVADYESFTHGDSPDARTRLIAAVSDTLKAEKPILGKDRDVVISRLLESIGTGNTKLDVINQARLLATVRHYYETNNIPDSLVKDTKHHYSKAPKTVLMQTLRSVAPNNNNCQIMYEFLLERAETTARGEYNTYLPVSQVEQNVPMSALLELADHLAPQLGKEKIGARGDLSYPDAIELIATAILKTFSHEKSSEDAARLDLVVACIELLCMRQRQYMASRQLLEIGSTAMKNGPSNNGTVPGIRGHEHDYWNRSSPGYGKIS
ncbi:MAG: hypothetical protein WBB39_05005 [Candidatus Saccharimonadales bacterium]